MKVIGLTRLGRAIAEIAKRVWDYAIVAGCCALAMGGCYVTAGGEPEGTHGLDGGSGVGGGGGGRSGSAAAGGAGVDGYGGCAGLYGPQPCRADEDCMDWHDGGDWYCDEDYEIGSPPCRSTWPTCLPGPEDAGD